MDTGIIISLLGVVVALIGWLVVPGINHQLSLKRERDAELRRIERDKEARQQAEADTKTGRKRDFTTVLNELQVAFQSAANGELIAKHVRSVEILSRAACKIEHDISNLPDFQRTLDTYLSLTASDIECRDQSAKPPPTTDARGNFIPGANLGWQKPCRYDLGRKRIKELLDKLCELANQP